MLKCDGFKMFHGSATIHPVNGKPYVMTGTWLYHPGKNCWYCEQDNSPTFWAVGVTPDIVSDIVDDSP